MINADKFKNIFGLYATELWSMPEKDFLKWLNSEAMNCSEFPNNSDIISRAQAIDTIEDFPHGDVWNVESMEEMVDRIKLLPSAEQDLIKCDYVKACNEVTMNKTFSAVGYLAMLYDFEEYGYFLVKRRS